MPRIVFVGYETGAESWRGSSLPEEEDKEQRADLVFAMFRLRRISWRNAGRGYERRDPPREVVGGLTLVAHGGLDSG